VEHSLIVKYRHQVVFTSDSHWLHPLFELADFLAGRQIAVSELFLQDKIAGKAAACMIARLGIRTCHIQLISKRAIPILEKAGIAYTYDEMVDQLECRTEILITDDMTVDEACLFLRKRAGKVEGLPVKIENLTVAVESKTILRDLQLELGAGEQLLIHGANGVGKTTLLKTMLGLIRPKDGVIKIGDNRVGSHEWEQERMYTAYVYQENIKSTFPISVDEVVAVGLAGVKRSSADIAYEVELAMRRTGCFNLRKRSYHSLSGGEKQRVSLARCLCQHAKVLLLDEPTSFLDGEGKDDLFALLQDLCCLETPTIIMVSLDPAWMERLSWRKKELKGGCLC
jgi:zinc transport system ATP-binding protein